MNGNDPYLAGLANIPGTSTFWGVGYGSNQLQQTAAVIERAAG